MAFRDAVESRLNNMQLGENGTLEYTNTGVGSNLLALSQIVRGGNPEPLVDQILSEGNPRDIHDLMVLIFATRNTRGGKGEKKLAYEMFLRVYSQGLPKTALALLKLFPHYGYWKDMLHLIKINKELNKESSSNKDEELFKAAINIMADQLAMDRLELKQYKQTASLESTNKPSISLLAKWLPRENASLDKKTGVVNALSQELARSMALIGGSSSADSTDSAPVGHGTAWQSKSKRLYRKTISELTEYLSLPEVLLSSQREEEIQFGRVASKAMMVLSDTFLNQRLKNKDQPRSDRPERIALADRFVQHLVSHKGLKGSQLMPHEIVRQIMSTSTIGKMDELVYNAQWKSLRESVVTQIQQLQLQRQQQQSQSDDVPTPFFVPLSDVSGSMYGTPLEVSIAMGILLSEITHPAFRDLVMTFESTPQWHSLKSSDTIVQKVRSLQLAAWGGSTNFIAAFRLLLKIAEEKKLPRADLPSLIVFSDMQFDEASDGEGGLTTMHEQIGLEYQATAHRLGWDIDTASGLPIPMPMPPTMVYWNLRNTGGHPVDANTEGAVLLSGFSPSLLKLVMDGKALEEVEVEVVETAEGGGDEVTITTAKVRVTPEQIVRKMLDDDQYDPVRAILATVTED